MSAGVTELQAAGVAIAWSVLEQYLVELLDGHQGIVEDGARRDEELSDLRHQLMVCEQKLIPIVEKVGGLADLLADFLKEKRDQDQVTTGALLADRAGQNL